MLRFRVYAIAWAIFSHVKHLTIDIDIDIDGNAYVYFPAAVGYTILSLL